MSTETVLKQQVAEQQVGGFENAVLNVESSALSKKWLLSETDARLAAGISQSFGIPEIVGRLLTARGIGFDDVENFLNPSLKAQLPDPYVMQDMEKAAKRIATAIKNGEKVAVFGDYDVDGATSSALFKRFFKSLGLDIQLYIPDRLKEGYGPNAPALLKLKENGVDLVITVDCGITSFEPLAEAKKAGLDIVVLDHHRAEADLPEADAVVNPNRLDDTSGLGQMAAVGVVFLTIIAVNRLLREEGFYKNNIPEPRLTSWLDIVALGTVCDVVPLTGINRAFVAQGLKVMALRQNVGITALGDVAGADGVPDTFHAGFLLGPRVNAGGRVGESGLGAQLLSTDDAVEAKIIAAQLHQLNTERRAIEAEALEQAIDMIEAKGEVTDRVLMVAGEGWHPGVIGIVAARLKEKYNRPTCVIAWDENGLGKASGRSVNGVDLGGAIIAAKQAGHLVNGGGHKMAAGFTVAKDAFGDLIGFVNAHVEEQLAGQDYKPELRIDGVLTVSSLNLDLVEKINMLAPFGMSNPEPRFALTGVRIVKPKVVGENHISCFIQDTAGGASLKAISFRSLDTGLGEILLKSGTAPVNLAGHVKINEWMGRKTVDFQIVDAAPLY